MKGEPSLGKLAGRPAASESSAAACHGVFRQLLVWPSPHPASASRLRRAEKRHSRRNQITLGKR